MSPVTQKNYWRNVSGCTAILVLAVQLLCAQSFFSVKPDYIRLKQDGHNLFSEFRTSYPDTGITTLHEYFPRNLMGNLGLPSPAYFMKYGTDDLGFRFFKVPYENDRFTRDDVEYMRTKGPYAALTGVAGVQKLQIFKAHFTHTYRNRINVNLRFHRYTSEGFYRRQQTYTNSFYLSSNYHVEGKRFGFYLYVINNSNKNSENGGIRDSSLNDSTALLTKELLAVRLTSADHDNRANRIMVNPFLRLNRRADSAARWSTYLRLRSEYSGNMYQYKDQGVATETYYDRVYLDTVYTNDSARMRKLSNELTLDLLQKGKRLGASIGFRHEYNYFWQHYDSVFSQGILVGHGSLALFNDSARIRGDLSADVQLVTMGPAAGDQKLEAVLALRDRKRDHVVFFQGLNESRTPDLRYDTWLSNHFVWLDNAFKPQRSTQVKMGWAFRNVLSLSLQYHHVDDLLYFDEQALPAQFSGKGVDNVSVRASLNKVFVKHIGVGVEYIYQNSSDPRVVRLAPNYLRSRLFYTSNLFRNHLQIQLGGTLEVFGKMLAYDYMPATQAFYLQHAVSTSAYPYLDVFLNARIRPVSIFLKVENVLQGYAGNDYFLVPGYYQGDRALRLGITWMFFD